MARNVPQTIQSAAVAIQLLNMSSADWIVYGTFNLVHLEAAPPFLFDERLC